MWLESVGFNAEGVVAWSRKFNSICTGYRVGHDICYNVLFSVAGNYEVDLFEIRLSYAIEFSVDRYR